MWRLNDMLLNNQWIIEEIKEEIKKISKKEMTTKTQHCKTYRMWQKQF